MPEQNAEIEVQALADALYADGELGPGYMFRDDCEHLARRVLATGLVAVNRPGSEVFGD